MDINIPPESENKKGISPALSLSAGRNRPLMFFYYVHIGCPQLLDKLEFDGVVGRGHDPADQVPVYDRGSFNGSARKKLRFGGGEPPPYGMNELFSVQQTDWKIAAGR
ncbi:hypothetical protein MR626_00330, partial [bacterium]|nr:hypothetical protein [bacterium]